MVSLQKYTRKAWCLFPVLKESFQRSERKKRELRTFAQGLPSLHAKASLLPHLYYNHSSTMYFEILSGLGTTLTLSQGEELRTGSAMI